MQRPFFIFLLLLFFVQTILADEIKTLRFGVLSFRPKEVTTAQWQPLAKELENNLSGYRVELSALTYPELDKAVKDKKIDLVLTNPEHYIILKNKLAMHAVATLIRLEQGHPIDEFAGVIFTRADREDIKTLADLNHKVIASPAEGSLGGYLMQRWQLEKEQIKAKSYVFTGMPHDNVIDEVLAGRVDAGFVRSGVLESLEKTGKLKLHEAATIKVIAPHELDADSTHKIYAVHSTTHYPEWAFAVGQHLDYQLTRTITLTLLNLQADTEVAKVAGIMGFNPPADYTPVETLMLRLRSHPDELKYFDFNDVLFRYRENIVLSSFFALLALLFVVFLIQANHRFKRLQRENQKLLLAVEQSPVAIFITDLNAKIEYANKTCCELTGFQLHELIGNEPSLFRSGKTSPLLYKEMWRTLQLGDSWHGLLTNRRKNGENYNVSAFITPIKGNGKIEHYLAIQRDVTEQLKIEQQIKQLAFHDTLTGLPNRRKLLDCLTHAIALSHREKKKLAIFMMDLDKFKAVNDTLGHAAGDDLLKQVAARIPFCLRESDMAARLGGDEFVIVLEHIESTSNAAQVANKVITNLTQPFVLSSGETVQIGASIGISFYPQHGDSAEKLIDCADTALYFAKDNGRGCFAYYEN